MCGKVYDCNVHTRYMGGFWMMILHQLPFFCIKNQDWSQMFDMCWGYPVECRSAVSYLYRCNRFFRVGIAPFWRRTLWISPQYTPIHGASSQGGLETKFLKKYVIGRQKSRDAGAVCTWGGGCSAQQLMMTSSRKLFKAFCRKLAVEGYKLKPALISHV